MVGAPMLGYASFIEPQRLRTRELTLTIPDLPNEFEELKIAQLTDFHYRPGWDHHLVTQAVAEAQDWQPDLITLTGDFMDHHPKVLPELFELLAPLQAPLGVFGILGNHDHYNTTLEDTIQSFSETNITLLVNQIHHLRPPQGGELQLIGLDSIYSSTPDFALPVGPRSAEQLRIVLSHEPDTFDQVIDSYRPHLQLSGHTHGGQCRIPFVGRAPFTPPYGRVYIDGYYQQADSHLFVSSGLGTSIVRMRFACLPEIALLTLTKAD